MDYNTMTNIIKSKEYSVKDTGVTYRIINNWTEKGLISHLRGHKNDWHKLSIFDLIEVLIYEELRKSGFTISKLLKIKHLLNEPLELKLPFIESPLNSLTYRVLMTLGGENNFLVVDRDANNPGFLEEIFLAEILTEGGPLMGETYQDGSSLTIISLHKLLTSLGDFEQNTPSKFSKLITTIIEKESSRQDISIIQTGIGKIQKIKVTQYLDNDPAESVNKLVNLPNQTTTFHSNNTGVQEIRIEREIK